MIPELQTQIEGNREVIYTLDKWLTNAKQGNISAIALVGCSGAGKLGMEYAGVVGKEIDAYFGLERLQQSLMDSINQRQLPSDAKEVLGADYVVYNRCLAPHCFDFLMYLINCEMARVREGAPAPLKVCFHGTPPTENEYTKNMFYNVMRPLLKLVGAVEDPAAIDGKRYNDYAVLRPAVEAYKWRKEPVPKLKSSPEAILAATRDFPEEDGYVTITFREADHFAHRNSNIPEWIKFAQYLKDQGERVIIVRDTAKAYEAIDGFESYPLASQDIDVRNAFYQRAKANFGCANGPMSLCWFGTKPVFVFTQVSEDDHYTANTPEWWRQNNGLDKGDQVPWCSPDQLIVWEPDTFEGMKKVWEKFIENRH